MTRHALHVQREAKPGREQDVATFLANARSMADAEPDTTAWFALKMGPSPFGIFDAFDSERGRDAHLQGKVAEQLTAAAARRLTRQPEIRRVEGLVDKLPY